MFPWSRVQSDLSPGAIWFDVHNHLLPDVDDGVPDEQTALQCVDILRGLGYRGTVITPHIYREVHDNSELFLSERFDAFHAAVTDRLDGFQIQLGAEYRLDDQFLDKLYTDAGSLLLFGTDPPKLLIEFSGLVEPLNAAEVIDECQRQRIQPIIAHVERYFFSGDTKVSQSLSDWRHRGALLQMNLGSLVGQYGRVVQRRARMLWRESMIDLLGTDMHRPYGMQSYLSRAWAFIRKKPNAFDPRHHQNLFELQTTPDRLVDP